MFGTIPARGVYLTTLEVTKAAVTKLGERYDAPAAALAGAASFMGGAAASASTQAVVVPIDVISQRLMMHGVAEGSSSGSNAGSSAAAASSSSSSSSRRVLEGMSQQPAASSSKALGQSGAAVPAQQAAAAAASAPHQPGHRGLHTSSGRSLGGQASAAPMQQAAVTAGQPHPQPLHGRAQPHAGSAGAQRLQLQRVGGVPRQLSSVAAVQRMNGFTMARLIIQQEGIGGLYRGFWPSLATFVPNSALWWGAYGFWQRFLWEQLPSSIAHPQGSSSSSSSGGSGSGAPSTGTVVAVQTTASVLSGCTASVLTNPLDLVKTRLQVCLLDGQALALGLH